jgi:essential nuclear protein 1
VFDNEGFYSLPNGMEGISKEDEEMIARLRSSAEPKPTEQKVEGENQDEENKVGMTLADLIMQKMNANQEKQIDKYDIDELEQGIASTMDDKIVKVYKVVGSILTKYISGKVPKPFKVIPALQNWQDILFLTKPFRWSPQAMFEATKIFTSNLKSPMAQQFYNLVLLPAVRSNIDQHNKLNYHLYMAVKKSVFKPSAFFKGFLLPLARDCSAREAAIIGSILIKVSLPVLHAAAAMLKLCEFDYSIGTSYFIKVLLGKNYALPSRVIDGVVAYFYSFCEEGLDEYDQEELAPMPVLWHQSLMIFVQKYKRHLNDEQKKKLKLVMRVRFNNSITPEIRKELFMKANRQSMAVD